MWYILYTLIFLHETCICITEGRYLLETKYIEVPVDHFSASPKPRFFKLRYLLNDKYHVKGGPAFVYTGNEGDISMYAQNTGFLFDIAPIFNALLVFIEHRYYGVSLPFGNDSFASSDNLRYLTTTQALADFAYTIEALRRTFFGDVLSYDTYPFVAFGGSYGGMLAAWLRMKYPYEVVGAVASSAPIFHFPGLTVGCAAFNAQITRVFRRYGGERCVRTVELGWDAVLNLSRTKLGMDFISSSWKLCKPLKTAEDVRRLLDWLGSVYENLSMFNYHYPADFVAPLPAYPVKIFCDKLTTAYFNDTKGLIDRFATALAIYTNYTGKRSCNNVNGSYEEPAEIAWSYQTCVELAMPKCSLEGDMFPTKSWSYEGHSEACYERFGVRGLGRDWPAMAYGGKNLRHYSNLVFSNGLMDPWSVGGVFSNVSSTVLAFNITDGPHHVDFRRADPADNNYVIEARRFHVRIIKQWLNMV
ncbi:unnamed protein product [Phyllotreta striolata]|uniref:Lysosomal Pro-X carboxypeptidase n=1 Tax=Phyllotreta striolata TaxID=444603 RepID=A0A9P0GUR6_PHYSR|nr:unnamed protein product [Phyllotreta striolata]